MAWSEGRVLRMIELTVKLTSSPSQWFSFAVIKANPSPQHWDGLGAAGSLFHTRAVSVVEPSPGGGTQRDSEGEIRVVT